MSQLACMPVAVVSFVRGAPMTDDDQLEEQADALLRSNGMLGKRAGCYSEVQLRKRWNGNSTLNEDVCSTTTQTCNAELLWQIISSTLARYHCPQQATECFRLHLMGYTSREIERVSDPHISHVAVCRRIKQARNLLVLDCTTEHIDCIAEIFALRMKPITPPKR